MPARAGAACGQAAGSLRCCSRRCCWRWAGCGCAIRRWWSHDVKVVGISGREARFVRAGLTQAARE